MLTSKETGSCKTAELACQILSSACSIDNLLTTKWPATVILQPEAGALKLTAELDRRPSCDNRRCFADPAHSLKVAPPPKTLQYKASYARSVDLGSYCSYPHQLMASQAEAYLQQLKDIGYVVFQLLNLQETHAAKQHIQNLEAQGVGFKNDIQHRIAELIPAGSPLMAQLVCNPLLLEVLHGYLGPRCRCATFSSNTLLPQDGSLGSGLGWHPDYPYHDVDLPWPPTEFPLGCQVLICLDEFREDNGGTMFMPQSHNCKPEGLEDDEDGDFPGSVTLTAPAGSVLIAHSAWWHRQTRNVSQACRTALLGNYTPGHVVPKDNMERQWHILKASPQFESLSKQVQEELEKLLLGPFKRGLYQGPPQP